MASFLRPDDEEVLGVLLLGGLREVERTGDDDRPVDDDDLVVGDGVLGVDIGGDAGVREKGRRRVLLRPLALVEDHFDLDPPLVRLEQGLGDRGGGEGVGLDADLRAGLADLPDDRLGGAVAGAEIDLDRRDAADVDFDGPGRRTRIRA